MSERTLYKDPTLEAAQQREIRQKGCRVCRRKRELSDGTVICSIGKTFPRCRETGGFKLITDA